VTNEDRERVEREIEEEALALCLRHNRIDETGHSPQNQCRFCEDAVAALRRQRVAGIMESAKMTDKGYFGIQIRAAADALAGEREED